MMITGTTPLLGMTLGQLQQVVAGLGMPRFAAGQICRWLYEKRATDIEQMTDLSKANRTRLIQEGYCVGRYSPVHSSQSSDGTVKYLFTVGDEGRAVESVFIPDDDRATLCISSQCGCKMGCTFCMTGRQGFHGDLTAHEIINQVLSIPQAERLTNVVFMGMGEPLNNVDAVLQAVEIMTAKWGMAWSPKRITVSTVGVIPGLKRLLDQTSVHVALSLHLPHHNERLQMMPVEKAYPLRQVLDLLRQYDFSHQRRLSVEYIMWRGINDDDAHAEALARLIKPTGARVNLIRFHALPGSTLESSDTPTMERFRDRLNSHGIISTIRRSRGEDIAAACGMLAGKTQLQQQ